MTNAVDSPNVENIVEGSRCATALASQAGIPEPLVLRFEEGGGSLPPGGSLWRKAYQGGSSSGSEIDGSRVSLEAPVSGSGHIASMGTERGPGMLAGADEGEYYISLAGAFRVIWRRL
jgi:hypothetical protein